MIEKVGHIKNPLSVIAIFAALAEVSGTLILPHLSETIQATYVWFLMVFPVLLVGLFFLTLVLKPVALYAPSDYRNEEIFEKLFVRATPEARFRKVEIEIADQLAEFAMEDDALPGKAQLTTENHKIVKQQSQSSRQTDTAARALFAEELAILKVSKLFPKSIFERHISPIGNRQYVFDAVSMGEERIEVVEVKYARVGNFIKNTLSVPFGRVASFYNELPVELQRNFLFIFVVVLDGPAIDRAPRISEQLQRIASDFTFRTRIEFFLLDELQREFDEIEARGLHV